MNFLHSIKNNPFISIISFVIVGGLVGVPVGKYLSDNNSINHMGHTNPTASTNNPTGGMMGSDKMMMSMKGMVTSNESFLFNMIPHHQEAIDTSTIILDSTTNEKLKIFAQSVITTQQEEVELMQQKYSQLTGKEYTTNSAYMPMMTNMQNKVDKELEVEYIQGMIGHHEGAIVMAEEASILQDVTPEIKSLSENIITTQKLEVTELKNLLKSDYGVEYDSSKMHMGH